MSNLKLSEWIEKFDNGDFDNKDRETQCAANWYDWFCSDEYLADRLKVLAPKLKNIAISSKINPEKQYVFFKNNCPVNGELYDDFRICDLETGDVVFTIVPFTGYKTFYGVAEVWGKDESGEFKRLVCGEMKDVYEFFGVEEVFKSNAFFPDYDGQAEAEDDDDSDW